VDDADGDLVKAVEGVTGPLGAAVERVDWGIIAAFEGAAERLSCSWKFPAGTSSISWKMPLGSSALSSENAWWGVKGPIRKLSRALSARSEALFPHSFHIDAPRQPRSPSPPRSKTRYPSLS
jgi:hypothetical protein